MRFRFVHAADIHLDSPLRGLSQALEGADLLSHRAFERVVALCLAEKVDFLLLAGDLYDKKDRSIRGRSFLREQLFKLHEAGIRTFIVHGNHDPLEQDPKGYSLPPSVKVFSTQWESVPLPDASGTVVCHVQGISYPTEKVTQNLSRLYKRVGPEFHIGLLHANVGENTGHANYAPCSVEDLARPGLDYWALGHVHTRKEYALSSGGRAVYPGNIQGRHINESGPRGCMLVDVDGQQVTTRFVPTHVLAWENLAFDFSKFETVEALIDGAKAQVLELCENQDEGCEALCLRLKLSGRGPLFRQLSSDSAWADLEDTLRMTLRKLPRTVHLESLENQIQPELDFEKLFAGSGLPGAVGGLAREMSAEKLVALLAADDPPLSKLLSLLKREGFELEPSALISRARARAVELLVGDDAS